MNEQPHLRRAVEPARSFDLVADAYDRGRPSYPDEALTWVLDAVRHDGSTIEAVELGAGTGKCTERLVARGCRVLATDPSAVMLERLVRRAPAAGAVAASAEQIPVPTRSADLLVAAQAFHWFDAERVLLEAARVLRPGGELVIMWNTRDERIPWVKRLGRIIGTNIPEQQADPTAAIDETGMFETVERATFRFWHPLDRESLRDLVSSRSNVALMSDFERQRVLRKVDDLYAEYGRMGDGMLLPYVTSVCRAAVLPWALPAEPEPAPFPADRAEPPPGSGGGGPPEAPDTGGDVSLLIDFR